MLAAGRAAQMGASVLLLEKNTVAGRKLLITGKGRCNITNTSSQSDYFKNIFPNPRFLKQAFGQFFWPQMLSLLNQQGLETVEERGNRVFPRSNLSKDVRDTLVNWAESSGVRIRYQHNVEKIITQDKTIHAVRVSIPSGASMEISCTSLILCCGGCSYPATGSDGKGYILARQAGHSIQPLKPSLVPLETAGSTAGELQGLSLKNVKASLWVESKKQQQEFGEMLFTHFGLSGPIILTLSRAVTDAVAKGLKTEIIIDLKPALDENRLDQRLVRDLNTYGKKRLENVFKLWLPSKMIGVFMKELQINPDMLAHQLGSADRRKIMLMMKNLRFRVTGHRSFKEAVVTAGGVSLAEIHSRTMESRLVKNLYFAGEILDLDANTGGYNLQIAWSSGWLAGESAAKALSHPSQ